jgi:thiol-disulfide isomerase/thioredoxin
MGSSDKAARKSEPVRKSFWTPGRIIISLIALGLVGALGLSSCNSNESTPPVTKAPPAGASPASSPGTVPLRNNPAPAAFVALPAGVSDTKLQTLDGDSFKLSDYKDKVVVVNIWATWCGPCRQEMPELVKMSNEYKARGLVVLGLATTYNEQNDQAHVKEYIKTQKVPYKIIWDDGTFAQPLLQAVQARSVIPQSFVISRDGRIVKHFQGFSPLSTPQLMRQAIEDALNDKSKA